MEELAQRALDRATRSGASYADVRAIESREQSLIVKNGRLELVADQESVGLGVRALVDGAWGFASCGNPDTKAADRCPAEAIEIARASASVRKRRVALAPEAAVTATWKSPCAVDPFTIPIEMKVDLLVRVCEGLGRTAGITLTEATMSFTLTRKLFLSSEGSRIRQHLIHSGAGYTAYSFKEGELQRRSYPSSFGGQHELAGYELVDRLRLLEEAPRVAEEAVALHSAIPCPRGKKDLILDSSQIALQIHESIGHPIELDRVLGTEANYAGRSFLTLDQRGRLQYGSRHVNVVADARLEHGPGVGTFAYDDEGVPAQRTEVLREGQFVGYLTSRETAREVGMGRSNGSMRAAGWNRIPLIRMTNVSLLPGSGRLEELIANTQDGIFMATNRSWSIDDLRLNFQFGPEIAWEIKKGRLGRMIKNPSYGGITPAFWNACDAVCGPQDWVLWGVPNCGKGQPGQVMATAHGAAPARFRGIEVGVANAAL